MGCFSCVQNCTKGLLRLTVNPVFEGLGNSYWTPTIIDTTWTQAETAKIPVSGAGYRGPFSGPGFDAMWTDMSEIVRPTRDGIHGREYISTSVDIGRKPAYLEFDKQRAPKKDVACVTIPMPLILNLPSARHTLPKLSGAIREAARRTEIIALTSPSELTTLAADANKLWPHIAFSLSPNDPAVPPEALARTRLVETYDGPDVIDRIKRIKDKLPDIIVSIRVPLDAKGVERAIQLAGLPEVEVLHVLADPNGNQTCPEPAERVGVEKPLFLKEMIRKIHTSLIERGTRDEVTLIAGGGIALAEHMAKAIICGADLISVDLPLMIGLECHLCDKCAPGSLCPAHLQDVPFDYAAGRMVNLIAAWHDQLIEMMGAMGMREARRLRGDVGRAMFFEDLEEETFGKLFGKRK
jgi:hypothetical protein